jgi:hypothetical protein
MSTRKILLVYALLGPPLGWLIYATGVIVGDAQPGELLSGLVYGVPLLVVGIPFSYVFGLIPALLMAAAMIASRTRPGLLHAGMVGLLCGLAFAIVFHRAVDATGLGVPAYFILKVLTCLVPSLICWWLASRRPADAV